MGFPTRTTRAGFGPTYTNERPVKDPTKELAAAIGNEMFWNLAGLSQTGAIGVFLVQWKDPLVVTLHQRLAFDPDRALPNLTFVRNRAGQYTLTFATSYPNEAGVSKAMALQGGIALQSKQGYNIGTHDGGMGVAALTDSAANFPINLPNGDFANAAYVHNIADGSRAMVTWNDGTNIQGALVGGTGNVWDIGDSYIVKRFDVQGDVVRRSAFSCDIFFTNDDVFMDPEEFILVLW